MICKVTLRQIIRFEPGETVYIRINYISLPKERSFIMTVTHLTVVNTTIDYKTLKIAMFINLTKKILKVVKKVRLGIIHKYTDIVYIMIDMSRVLTILTITIAAAFIINLFISV